MNDVVLGYLKDYAKKESHSVYALRDWKNINMKDFTLIEALECIYLAAYGHPEDMTKIIRQLTDKKKVFGRSQVYNDNHMKTIDIVRDDNGKLKLIGYDPDKEEQRKGQHGPRNLKIFRKSDGQVSRNFQHSEEKIHDFGEKVRNMFPDKSNQYITHAMQAIKNYANKKKVSPDKVLKSIEKGRLRLLDDEYNSFKIVPKRTDESRVIVITESMMNMLHSEVEMTEYKFQNNIKKFLSDLLADPVNASPSKLLLFYGLTRSRLLKHLSNVGMVERDERISDKDENGEAKTATMLIRYKVPKKNFKRKLKKLWIRLFERNLPERNINEEGEGATSACASGEVVKPLFDKIIEPKSHYGLGESTTTSTVGDYEYDVPFAGDEESIARKNGKGGSVSVNIA